MTKYSKNRTTSQAKDLFREVHGDTYNYDKFIYVSSKNASIIGCKKHGDFLQSYGNHISGNGCIKCGEEKCAITSRKTTPYIVGKFKEKHGDRYDYSKTFYIKATEKLIITCLKHGDFSMLAHDHIYGKGCRLCGNEKRRHGVGMSLNKFVGSSKSKNNGFAKFYIIKCSLNSEIFYKFGITIKTLHKRFYSKTLMPYDYSEILAIDGDAESIHKLESLFRLSVNSYYKPEIKFGGYSECFLDLNHELQLIVDSAERGFINGMEKSTD